VIIHHQEVISVHVAYGIVSCIDGCLDANTMRLYIVLTDRHP